MPDATLTGVETRTSSPLWIRRNESYQSINTQGLYPTDLETRFFQKTGFLSAFDPAEIPGFC